MMLTIKRPQKPPGKKDVMYKGLGGKITQLVDAILGLKVLRKMSRLLHHSKILIQSKDKTSEDGKTFEKEFYRFFPHDASR